MEQIKRFGFQFSEKVKEKEYKAWDMMEIQIMREGKWEHYEYWDIEVDQNMMNEIIMNFKTNKARQEIAVNENHDPDGKAVAWFKDVYKKDGWLYAEIKLTKKGSELMNDKVYKYFSPEYLTQREDGETGEEVENLLIGWGFTNHPYFKDMEKVVANDKSMLSEMDKSKHILSNKQETMAEEKAKTPEEETKKVETEEKEEVETKEVEAKEDKVEEDEKKEMSEKVDAQKFSEMKKEFAETKKKYNELLKEKTKKQFSEKFDELVKNEKGMLPKDKDQVIEFCEKIGEENAKVFFDIVGSMKNVADFTKETEEDKKFSEEDVTSLAKKYADENNVKLSKAYTEVMKKLRK